jgi:hypothetical protein
MGERTVIGQEDQPFAVAVKPTDRVETLDREELLERPPPAAVGELAEDVVGFEQLVVTRGA